MQLETERLLLRELIYDDFESLYEVLADSDIMQHYPYNFDENRVRNWITKNIERYQIFGFGLWAFENTPINTLYSYMKGTNIASYSTAMSMGMRKVDEFIDEENETTVVYAITRKECQDAISSN